MDEPSLRELLGRVAAGRTPVDEAIGALSGLSDAELGFARIDRARALRCGTGEAVYCPGKTPDQIVRIAERLVESSGTALATRADAATADALLSSFPDAVYHYGARAVVIDRRGARPAEGLVAVVSAGTADIPIAEEALVTARWAGSRAESVFDVGVAGVHRLLAHRELLESARAIVVVAGMDGALPSIVGGLFAAPVVAVPTSVGYGAAFGGLAALLGMLTSCAPGVVVVNIDNGFGAGIAAHRMQAQTSKRDRE